MATTELHKVPDTILSRCQQFEFRTIALNKIIERLKIIAEAEKINISAEALREIARAGEGSMRDAQSAFDQVISFSGEKIEVKDVTNALGIAETDLLNRIIAAIAEQKSIEALKVVDQLVSRGQDLRNFCRDLLTHLRDLLVAKVAGDAEGLLDSAVLSADELQKQAAVFSESDLTRFFHSLSETETKLREALQPRYVLEVGLVKLIEMRRVSSLEKVLERIANLESALQNGGDFSANSGGNQPNSPKPPIAPPNSSASVEQAKQVSNFQIPPRPNVTEKPVSEQTAAVEESKPAAITKIEVKDGEDVRQSLQNIFEQQNKMWLSISLEKATSAKISGNQLRLEFALNNKQYHATWESGENLKMLQEICQQLFGQSFEIANELTGSANIIELSPEEARKQKEKDALWQIAEADPIVQTILKTFRGKIIDVCREENPAEKQEKVD